MHLAGDWSGVYVNGCLHCLAPKRGADRVGWFPDYLYAIVAFDLANESCWEVPLPDLVYNYEQRVKGVAILGGCLCLINSKKGIGWMMEEYGLKESWTKFTIFNHERSVMELVCLLENGEFLLAMDSQKLLVYNPKEQTSRDMVVNGIPTMFTVGGTYVESLVSLDCGNVMQQCEALDERIKWYYRTI
ncbi:F-box protein [Camellia lanceoleosa]|uniref:F-box protein n=1 Tax=Camellia lanceoleosa TaxID=1840588 RepID=A0ACC0HE95_9ERIC|nr:F-box protein [Camellia lanceoleosa]